jgi:hypothetical protein
MTKDEAREMILAAWRKLPEEERLDEHKSYLFAIKQHTDKAHLFKADGDKLQYVWGWVRQALEQEKRTRGR